MASLLSTLELEAFKKGIPARTKTSREWFREKAKGLRGKVNRQTLIKDEELIKKTRTIRGNMFMFFYDAKHRKTLPYWDAFPLIIALDKAPGGFYGINLHYLPPVLRAKFLDALLDTVTNDKYDDTTRMNIRYNILKSVSGLRYYKPCIKRYLTSQVDSNMVMVQPTEWEVAVFLPTEQFRGKSRTAVWKESRKMI
jgi:hypothetical protein